MLFLFVCLLTFLCELVEALSPPLSPSQPRHLPPFHFIISALRRFLPLIPSSGARIIGPQVALASFKLEGGNPNANVSEGLGPTWAVGEAAGDGGGSPC